MLIAREMYLEDTILNNRWVALAGCWSRLAWRPNPPPSSLVCQLFVSNLWPHGLESRFQLRSPYEVHDETVLNELPVAYHSLSNIGFNRDKTMALFYAEFRCGLCGWGGFVLMKKSGGKWVVANHYGTWIS